MNPASRKNIFTSSLRRWWQFRFFVEFSPRKLGEGFQFDEHIFQMGWNHQPLTFSILFQLVSYCDLLVNLSLQNPEGSAFAKQIFNNMFLPNRVFQRFLSELFTQKLEGGDPNPICTYIFVRSVCLNLFKHQLDECPHLLIPEFSKAQRSRTGFKPAICHILHLRGLFLFKKISPRICVSKV